MAVINKIHGNGERGLKAMYDIACRVRPQLISSGLRLDNVSLAVPVFHGYSHDAGCQVKYNPRLLKGFRMADGENIERFWSYFGQFAYITREMSATNRQDLLVNALLHMSEKVLKNAPATLTSRLKAARKQADQSARDIAHMCENVQGKVLIIL